jgi:hypothetical protein
MNELKKEQTFGNDGNIEVNANPAITEISVNPITELKEKIFNEIPLGLHKEKFDKLLAKYFKELKADDSVISSLTEIITIEYEKIHYNNMAEMFVKYGLTAEKIKVFQTLEENIFNFSPHIWNMRYFDFDVKLLANYINGTLIKREIEEPVYDLNTIPAIIPNEDDVIIKNFIHKKQYLMMVGQPKIANKTRTACNMAVYVSKGLPFLGMETKTQRVLCMLLEDTKETALKRFNGFGGSGNITFDVSKFCGILRLRSLLQKAIEEGNPYGLVIIDTYLIFTGVKEINNYAENVLAGFGIKNIAEEFNVGIIVIHHTNKNKEAVNGNEVLGSNAILGTTDGHITLKAINEDKDIWEENEDTKLSMDISLRHFKSPESIIYLMTNSGATLIGTKKYNDRKNSKEEIIGFIQEKYSKGNYFSRNDLMNDYNTYLKEQGKDILSVKNIRTITNKLEAENIIQIENGKGITLL